MNESPYPWLIGMVVALVVIFLALATITGDLPPPGWENPANVTMNATAGLAG